MFNRLPASIDPGEAEAIALAKQEQDRYMLLLDDLDARDEATRQGLALTGTIGILRMARDQKLIERVYPILLVLRQQGFWISSELLARIRSEEP
ncbi:MAG: DUF3368 domain-containing protein [Dehalococcoidia bacterium]